MELVKALCDRRYTEKTVACAESHDQALVGPCPAATLHCGDGAAAAACWWSEQCLGLAYRSSLIVRAADHSC